ncbi:MAG: anaerobic ribonucleoside-triphosphate reductase [Solobacterium sp.]|nr:anaerobic ribonucleoside-triphosphate reductase [Solobacterium sp.]MDY2952488.1 anaerobic ribonucleoside-triphosphate reductase [Erysipelotrichaceae bacterium]MCI6697353.1 anaerobic ribonucleoside-triphosphate reductase [Solobacterium sp.]MCI6879073.1 anaerobic ribonucleoside-triphosphate reductase [Solobacterium sp.]MCI7157163.1 anaerobic ribonucleoside-triphosphate reductase [Solobacterium sp.]
MNQIKKRKGNLVAYDPEKIRVAITSANHDIKKKASDAEIEVIFEAAKNEVEELLTNHNVSVEEINDIVERAMMKYDCYELAKQFIEYRYRHKLIRESNTTDESIFELINGKSEYWNEENSNKNARLVTTQRDYIAGIVNTDIARRFLLPKDVVKAHDEGIIHEHDMDYLADFARHNCELINLEDMLQNGTVLNGVMIEKPHRFITASTIATQIMTAVSASSYGGLTVTLTHLAPFVRSSFYRHYKFFVKEVLNEELNSLINEDTRMDSDVYASIPAALDYATKQIKKEVEDGVQTFNYQINSMSSTNGQSPFCSVFMYLNETDEYKDELAMIIEEFLKQRIQGLKNEKGIYVTQAFPKLLYVLEEDNITEGSRYWYLTELSAKCSAKRLVPDYVSEKMMKSLKINKFGVGDCYGPMGCRSFLTPDRIEGNPANALNYDPNKGKYWGRFNMGVCTVNLFDAALSSNRNEGEFWKLLDDRCELCHTGLKVRINRLASATSDVAPILWQHGALARLQPHEKLEKLVYGGYSTASLGYAALYECVKYMTGLNLTDKEGEAFGMRVMNFLNDKCAKWKKEENIDYSVYGTPLETTTYKFAKMAKKKFGDDVFVKLDGHDRDYVTNSSHTPVFQNIDAFDKLDIDGKFQELSPGGNVIYIETPNLQNNIEAILEVIKYMYDHTMYGELNTKSDYCMNCGYDGEIMVVEDEKTHKLVWECPNCKNRDQNKMQVTRRTCGYLGSHYWNQGRTDEIRSRVLHLDNVCE